MGLTVIIITCPHCGKDQDIEEELLDHDELECQHCGQLVFDED